MKKKATLNYLFLSTIFVFSIVSCTKELDEPNTNLNTKVNPYNSNKSPYNEGQMIIGNQLQNPYTINNMQAAFNNLVGNGILGGGEFNVRQTHLYVKFEPNSEDELITLKADTTLELYSYPLDYEIPEQGTYYHDPSVPESQPTPQYTVIQPGQSIPPLNYTILEELYIPELDDEADSNFIDDLVDEALLITDNYEEEEEDDALYRRRKKWTPSGTIRVWDDEVGTYIASKATKVRARRWFNIKSTYTNHLGQFATGRFRRPVNYSIKWETNKYDIRDGHTFQAIYNGPKRRGMWNLDIASGKSIMFATINRAASRYHYFNIGGLKRPNVWTKLKIAYIDGQGSGVNWGNNWQRFVLGGALPNIKIWGKYSNQNTYKPTDLIFGTTIHELGHSSHVNLMNGGIIQYSQVDIKIYESWATAIEWYITQIEYNSLGLNTYDDPNQANSLNFTYLRNHRQNFKRNNSNFSQNYTPVFIDMVDNFNQALNLPSVYSSNQCPNGGWQSSGSDLCGIGGAPVGETSFIYNENFYVTPVGCCICPRPGSTFDGANCFVHSIPSNALGLILNNQMYLWNVGDTSLPFDQIDGYTMSQLEQNVVKYSYGFTSLRNKLKSNKPSGITDKHIDIYLNYY